MVKKAANFKKFWQIKKKKKISQIGKNGSVGPVKEGFLFSSPKGKMINFVCENACLTSKFWLSLHLILSSFTTHQQWRHQGGGIYPQSDALPPSPPPNILPPQCPPPKKNLVLPLSIKSTQYCFIISHPFIYAENPRWLFQNLWKSAPKGRHTNVYYTMSKKQKQKQNMFHLREIEQHEHNFSPFCFFMFKALSFYIFSFILLLFLDFEMKYIYFFLFHVFHVCLFGGFFDKEKF